MNVRVTGDLSSLRPAGTEAGQKLAVADDPISFAAFTEAATHVLVSVGTKLVNVTFDGTAPAADTGIELPVGYVAVWSRETAAAAIFHQGTGGAGVVYGTPMA